MINIIADFILFSIFGYIGEVIYCGLNKRKSGKGLRGPWCPLYGLGGTITLYIVSTFEKNFFLIYILGVIIASIVEYTASLILEMIFKTKWWDYNDKKFNINGRICLGNSLLFGVMALILFSIYIPGKELLLEIINPIFYNAVVLVTFCIMCIDGLLTIFEAYELKNRLEIVNEEGLKNKEKNERLNKLKPSFNFKRLLSKFEFNDENAKYLKKYYKIKSSFINKK